MSEICKKCAECCKNYPFIELSENEINALEDASGLDSNDFTNAKRKVVEEYFMQFKDNGDCVFLTEKDGSFSCTVYEARPGVCRNYPAKGIQEEFCVEIREKYLTGLG